MDFSTEVATAEAEVALLAMRRELVPDPLLTGKVQLGGAQEIAARVCELATINAGSVQWPARLHGALPCSELQAENRADCETEMATHTK